MDKIEVFKTWAPIESRWTVWAKPVVFANISDSKIFNLKVFNIPDISYPFDLDNNTAMVLDLPAETGILEGLSLAKYYGYRAVPLYNGCTSHHSQVIETSAIEAAIIYGAHELKEIETDKNAPPVFLLDSLRMSGKKISGRFDNRWCIFPQDFSSADFMLNNSIKKIVVKSEKIADDLSHILYRYQEKGIVIFHMTDRTNMKKVIIKKPQIFKYTFYRFLVLLGLRQNAAGGFGGVIADHSNYIGRSG